MNFVYWNVMIDIGFWTRLARKKIEEYKLQASVQPLTAKCRLSNKPDRISILSLDAYSFQNSPLEHCSGPVDLKFNGTFLNTNTVEQFDEKNCCAIQQKLFNAQINSLKNIINNENVTTITEIFLLTFGDLKRHIFKYQFYSTSIPVNEYKILSYTSAKEKLSQNQVIMLNTFVKSYVNNSKQLPQLNVLKNFISSSFKQFIDNPESGEYLFLISDTSNYPKSTGYHTSTCFAIFAYLLEAKLVAPKHLSHIKIFLMKQFLIHNLQTDYAFKNSEIVEIDFSQAVIGSFDNRLSHKKNVFQLDLKSFMDERTLAKEAVDLNIKLMKWRLLPTLNIEKIQSSKCLLFGAGTLGCQLSRNLIGWGVKNITFIDYSNVSYSNPVRQSLYDYQDTLNGGKPKAEAAAQKLKKIYPQINAVGHSMSIPMPGHYVTKEKHIKQSLETIDKLQALVKEHDVLFLLLDSRQARWLPTVLANVYDKMCITVGLGFDSFVIVRHGVPPQLYDCAKHGQRLCCYFCNDIVTPQNTMKDRTLDQMCTVTKPGLSFVSAAYAVELFISLLHHPLQHHAPANQDSKKLLETDIGKLPHHLRGNMSDFETNIYYGKAFDQCVACSKFIFDQYCNHRNEFILKVLNDPSFIHQVVHLKQELEKYAEMENGIIQIIDDQFMQDLNQHSEKLNIVTEQKELINQIQREKITTKQNKK